LLSAPAIVLHWAVRLHGFASSPKPATHVRPDSASALAGSKDIDPRTAAVATAQRTVETRIVRYRVIAFEATLMERSPPWEFLRGQGDRAAQLELEQTIARRPVLR
jgi:hypothetical protein